MQLTLLGWDETFSSAFAPYSCSGLTAGRVILQHNHIYTVATEAGEVHSQVSGHLRHATASADELPAVGDWVALRLSTGDGTALIQTVLPRRSKFSRKAAGRSTREQVVAANIDTVFLLIGMDNDFSPRRVERYWPQLGKAVPPRLWCSTNSTSAPIPRPAWPLSKKLHLECRFTPSAPCAVTASNRLSPIVFRAARWPCWDLPEWENQH